MYNYFNTMFCLCYLPESDDKTRINNFIITNDYHIALNGIGETSGYKYKIFSNFYEAQDFLLKIMDFEDKFLFGIEREIILNNFYFKEE